MPESFHELVVEGPLLLIKGYIVGILVAEGLDARDVLFAEEHAVDCGGLIEQLGEWMHLHRNVSHLLVPQRSHGDVKRRLQQAEQLLGLKIQSDRLIESASVKFTYTAYTKRHFAELDSLIRRFSDNLRISPDYAPTESVDPGAKGAELYTTAHEYQAHGTGTLSGDPRSILEFHKLGKDQGLLKLSKITLHHADD